MPPAHEIGDYCMECGAQAVVRKLLDGQPIDECELCGALFGNPDAIQHIEDQRDANTLGIDPIIFPLVRELDAIRGVRCFESHGGEPVMKTPPFVKFRIGVAEAMSILESIVTSLALSNMQTFGNWHLEVISAGQVGFELRPKLPANPEMHEVFSDRTRDDVPILAKNLSNHKKLRWWRA